MCLMPEVQKLVKDSGFFNYSESENPVQSEYDYYPPPNEKIQEFSIDDSSYLVKFSGKEIAVVVGMVDMVLSTKICAQLGPSKAAKYYQIFINSMSKIISMYDGIVIKNMGDCLMFYFPCSSTKDKYFENCLNAGTALLDLQSFICDHLHEMGLPCIDYRVSLDYGNVLIMNSNISSISDMIGPPINMCAKINRSAKQNEMVIGGDLYEIVKKKNQFKFKNASEYNIGFRHSYPVYKVSGNKEVIKL